MRVAVRAARETIAAGDMPFGMKGADMEVNMRVGILSGAIAGLATCLVAGLCARSEKKPVPSPINATSHILWGDLAAEHDGLSWKYTGTGVILNEVALIFWAGLYEAWPCRHSTLSSDITRGIAVAALAYVTDYMLIPKRFTPGFEKRLSGRSLFLIYCGIATSLMMANRASRKLLQSDAAVLHRQ
jgi:hypothetical protein